MDAVDDVKMPALSRSVMVKSEVVKYGCDEWVALNLGWMICGRRLPNVSDQVIVGGAVIGCS